MANLVKPLYLLRERKKRESKEEMDVEEREKKRRE